MVVKIIIIICYVALIHFLVNELVLTRRWKMCSDNFHEGGMNDEEFEKFIEMQKEAVKQNDLIEWFWNKPFRDVRRARKLGFIRIPMHLHFGLLDNDLGQGASLYYQGRILTVDGSPIVWKDKYETPRFEFPAYIRITLFARYTMYISWGFDWKPGIPLTEQYDNDDYWEQALWCWYYADKSLEKGRETWPWKTSKDGVDVSTWDERYIKKNKRK
jgi:hypothetical protein